MHFLDQAKIFVRSGTGGPGAVSFRREKFIEYGGPDGGNGGKGGDIVFEAVAGLNTLIDFRYTQHFRAQRGHGGSGSNRTGGGGDDLVIKVPVGTQVLSEDKEEVLLDFTKVGQREVFLRGGFVRDAVAAMLLPLGLANASALVVSGTSAGGLAALMHVDWSPLPAPPNPQCPHPRAHSRPT